MKRWPTSPLQLCGDAHHRAIIVLIPCSQKCIICVEDDRTWSLSCLCLWHWLLGSSPKIPHLMWQPRAPTHCMGLKASRIEHATCPTSHSLPTPKIPQVTQTCIPIHTQNVALISFLSRNLKTHYIWYAEMKFDKNWFLSFLFEDWKWIIFVLYCPLLRF